MNSYNWNRLIYEFDILIHSRIPISTLITEVVEGGGVDCTSAAI